MITMTYTVHQGTLYRRTEIVSRGLIFSCTSPIPFYKFPRSVLEIDADQTDSLAYIKFQITTSGTPPIKETIRIRFSKSIRSTFTRSLISLCAVVLCESCLKIASRRLAMVHFSRSSSKVSSSNCGNRERKILSSRFSAGFGALERSRSSSCPSGLTLVVSNVSSS